MPQRTIAHVVAITVSLGMLVLTSATVASPTDQAAWASAPTARKTAFAPSEALSAKPGAPGIARGHTTGSDNVLVFSAPPRENEEEAMRTYQPIAEYLARITGKTIVYQRPADWITYQTEMQRGGYDLVFDGAHFNSWRISNLQHSALVKLADEHAFAVVVRKDENRIIDIKQLAGQKVCAMNPPNLGTLAVLNQFENPMRQPFIMNNMGWARIYEGVAFEKKCAAGILPVALLKKFPNSENLVRVLYKTKTLPNQAFSAGPRISREDQAKIAAALISPEGSAATARLMSTYGTDKGLAYANKEEYAGLDVYLKDTWGYSR